METKTIGFIGGGRITKIFLRAFASKKAGFKSIVVFDANPAVAEALKEQFPEINIADSALQSASQEVVFIALHPPVIMETLTAIKDEIKSGTIVVSLAPKITIEKMAALLPTQKIVRLIPNATSYINDGYNPVSFSQGFGKSDKKTVVKLLKLLGKTFETDEAKLESYAIMSAMLPTYFWFQWQELENIGQQIGLDEAESRKAIQATMKKALKLYFKSGLIPSEVIDLIPVKPLSEHEGQIKTMYQEKLVGLFGKIKP
jgi:pyrroline-5-carboxylate reductase